MDRMIHVEVLTYLSCAPSEDEQDLSQLEKFTYMKKIFIKYNTIISSSAPVERVFSFAKMLLRPQRQRLSDKTFEQLLVLKNRGIQFDN